MHKILHFIAELPTTNARIVSSIVMAMGTWIKILATGWVPTWEWLVFLIAWAGIDAAQFATKRITHVTEEGHTVWGRNGNVVDQFSKETKIRRDFGNEDGTEPV